ncbi:hypothetical protein [Streptomyces apocyni]|uniref:hypothetical protein n=1 Tax=Streptomyces apocyni TaxID=2654677 RepID=UPI001E5AEFD5|nr:hypothetical protein [Streptomyces apocyni]
MSAQQQPRDDGRRPGLTVTVYRVNPNTGARTPARTRVLAPADTPTRRHRPWLTRRASAPAAPTGDPMSPAWGAEHDRDATAYATAYVALLDHGAQCAACRTTPALCPEGQRLADALRAARREARPS